MRENTDQSNSEYGHFLRSDSYFARISLDWKSLDFASIFEKCRSLGDTTNQKNSRNRRFSRSEISSVSPPEFSVEKLVWQIFFVITIKSNEWVLSFGFSL